MLKIVFKFKFLMLFLFPFFNVFGNLPEDSIYNLNSKLLNSNGKTINFSELEGKIHIFSMIYTNCKTICPIIVNNMKSIEKALSDDLIDNVNFTLVSLDPDRDNVDSLRVFFLEKKLNSTRWNLFTASKDDVLKISLSVGIKYKKENSNEYSHSNLIVILDKHGVVRYRQQGLDKNYFNLINLIKKLI